MRLIHNTIRLLLFILFFTVNLSLYSQTVTKKHTVYGYVTDDISGEVLIGANVFNPVTGEGSQTNEYGFYSLTMAEGEATLLYSYIGYKSNKVELFLDKKKELHIKLHPNAELDEVIVYGNKSEAGCL